MIDEKKIKHLEFIQNIVSRMADCSFKLKGWTIAITTAVLGFIFANNLMIEEKYKILNIAIIFISMFWYLDSYYVRQERIFRDKYNEVRVLDESNIDFSMESSKEIKNEHKNIFCSKTLIYFYLPIVLLFLYLKFNI
jgi:hypothetical protein